MRIPWATSMTSLTGSIIGCRDAGLSPTRRAWPPWTPTTRRRGTAMRTWWATPPSLVDSLGLYHTDPNNMIVGDEGGEVLCFD